MKAISNTSPLLYLYRIDGLDWIPKMFDEVWIPAAVVLELEEGQKKGFVVPNIKSFDWLKIINPNSMPSEWLTLDLGAGELAAMALALEQSEVIILLDDAFARRTAKAANLEVWGTLKILLESKSRGLIKNISPFLIRLKEAGLWISDNIQKRVLALADEK